MKLSDFDYEIPADLVAQHPLKERDSSRLLVVHRDTGKLEHRTFRDIASYLRPGDVLVLNDTKVVPVRLYGKKSSGGKAEITLVRELGANTWEALVKGLHEGRIILGTGIIADVTRMNGTSARVEFTLDARTSGLIGNDIKNILKEIGAMPLPVYIKRNALKSDLSQYQTVYARNEGAVAAPTAGLHFTENLLESIRSKGIDIKTITHHVGYGTFKPVTEPNIVNHRMDDETFIIPESTADAVNSALQDGRRIIAVGTTVTRALESAADKGAEGMIRPGKEKAEIFIFPGYRFRVINILLTNFHLPKSTPMMLAAAFAGLDILKKAYSESQEQGYRFFSYGDAMMIVP